MAVIGNLVANLVADTSKFTAPMQQAEAQVNKTAASVRAASGSVTGGIGAVVGGVGAALSGIAVAGLAAAAGLAGAMSVTIAARKQVAKLEAVVASTGMAAGFTAAEIIDFADSLELVNDVNADVTTSAAAVLATFTQIKGDVFKEALVSAQDLSAVMGQDMQSSVVQIGKALNDPITGLTALRRVGVSFTEQQREQITQMVKSGDVMGAQKAILEELKTEFGGAAKAMSNPFVILYNVAGRAIEGIGALVLPTLQSMATMLTTVVAPAATDLLLKFEAIGDGIRDSLVPPMAAAIAIATNLGTFMQLAAAQTGLAMVQAGNATAYFFTDQIPVYFNWFLDNWSNLWTDALSITQTAVTNLAENIGSNMAEIWNYIASGGTSAMELTWKPLLDGFKSTVSELPQIAERVPGAMEKGLGKMVSDLEGKLQADMADTMDALQGSIDKKPLTPRVKGPPGAETDTAAKDKGAAALQMGSKEAISSIFASMRGADKQDEMLRIQQQQLGIQQQQLDALEGMAADEGLEID
jgi:hypothetical protein